MLLHGLTATRRYVVMGSRQFERSGHRVVAYDARAHGASSPAPDPDAYDYDDFVEDLRAARRPRDRPRGADRRLDGRPDTVAACSTSSAWRLAATPAFDPEEDREAGAGSAGTRCPRACAAAASTALVEAYGDPQVPEQWKATVDKVLRQRLAHEHPEAVADAARRAALAPVRVGDELAAIEAPTVVVASRDDLDPGHPYGSARPT